MTKKRILVIGAGVAGLVSIKACKEENFDVVCYERTSEVGGLWYYRGNDQYGVASVMKSTISNSSKEMTSFSDFPPPSNFPTYMHHTIVLKYLKMYGEHFDLLAHINYHQEVLEVIPNEDYGTTGKWIAKVRNLHLNEIREEIFDGVMACSGHHAHPYTPLFPNMDLFTGRIMHSHNYRTYSGLEEKNIVVVGSGNSGVDIAAELSNVAKKVYLSTRRGAWIYPRLFDKGKPADICFNRRYKTLLPSKYLATNLEKFLNKRMDHERFGMKPCHPVSSQHPTINDEIYAKLLTGRISAKGDIKEFSETSIIFDGENDPVPADVVVFATGFQIKFPYISDDVLRLEENSKVSLFKLVFPPHLKHHTLAIIGLVQPFGSLFPVFELQARWFAALMAGRCRLPTAEQMLADIREKDGFRAKKYVKSPRHSIEAPWIGYMDEVASLFGAKPKMGALFVQDP